MFNPIITPSQTAVMFAPGSANKIGATMGTTTTAISMKSRKKPSIKITAITIMNFAQKPPGIELRKLRTNSSPPKARKAAVNTAAPKRIIKTREVVFAVSSITSCIVLSNLSTLKPLQIKESMSKIEPKSPIQIPVLFAPVAITAFTFILKFDRQYDIIIKDMIARIAG